jgi:hypothetical protein
MHTHRPLPALRPLRCGLSFCLLFNLLLAFAPGFRPPAAAAARAQALKPYTVSPNKGRPGKDYDVLVVSRSADCGSTNELTDAYLVHPEGGDVAVVEGGQRGNGEPCVLRAKIRVPADAAFGAVTLRVVSEEAATKKASTLGVVEFGVADGPPPPGVIPPGVNPPAVDIMWSVMPKGVVGDNFGRKLKNDYYAVEVVIGNNSAYNLQIVSVGFELPSDAQIQAYLDRNARNRLARKYNLTSRDPRVVNTQQQQQQQEQKARIEAGRGGRRNEAAGELSSEAGARERKTILPSSSYRITRGSMEARHMTHARTLVLSTITALGPIFTGFTPYFRNVNHRANYAEGINILSNPLEKGLELVWPDPRERQRERFDDQVLRDGLIIRNNTQVRTLVFFPKDLLRLPGDVENEREYQAWRNNAREVRERLGQLIIIGDVIQYQNRVTLVANPPGPVAPPPTVSSPAPVKQGTRQNITLRGANLQGADVQPVGDSGIRVEGVDVDENGRVVTAVVDVADTVRPGTYGLEVTTAGGRDEVQLVIDPQKVQVDEFVVPKVKAEAFPQEVEVTATGKFLHDATLEVGSGQLEVVRGSVTVTPDGKQLRARVRILSGTPDQKLKVVVRNPQRALEDEGQPFDIELVRP